MHARHVPDIYEYLRGTKPYLVEYRRAEGKIALPFATKQLFKLGSFRHLLASFISTSQVLVTLFCSKWPLGGGLVTRIVSLQTLQLLP